MVNIFFYIQYEYIIINALPDSKYDSLFSIKNILHIWFDFKSTDRICNTSPILFKGKIIIFKSWIEIGMLFVNDIIHPTSGKIDEHLILDKLKP